MTQTYKPFGLSRSAKRRYLGESAIAGLRSDPPPPDVPFCPRAGCGARCSGRPGNWWCGECSAPVVDLRGRP